MALDFGVNWLAVLVSAVAGFIVSWLWWGPLFGKQWMKYMGYTSKDMKKEKEKGMGGKMLIAFIAQLIMAYVLAALLLTTGSLGYSGAVVLAFWVWLGFVATIGVGMVLWSGKPWGFFWLNMLGWLATLVVIGLVLGFWG